MTTTFQHITDPTPFILSDGESLHNQRIVCGGAVYGRVLFTTFEPMLIIAGQGVTITNCHFEAQR